MPIRKSKGLIDDDWPRSIRSAPSAFEPTIDDVLGLLSGVETTRFQPGAEWEYSNSGYVVLAGVVEAVSGFPLPEFLDERVFGPLGMTRSFISSGVRPDREGVASSYAKRGGAYREIDYAPQSAIYGSNNVYSTILLARASKPEQEPFVGDQAGGRVFLFLTTDDFRRDYDAMVAVFKDLYGNLWDLLQLRPGHPMARRAGIA